MGSETVKSSIIANDSRDSESSDEPVPPQSPFASFGINAGVVEEIHETFQVDPDAVDASWSEAFGHKPVSRPQRNTNPRARAPRRVEDLELNLLTADKNARVLRLIHAYRARGHRIANSDPLAGQSKYFPELDPAHYGFGSHDLDHLFSAGDLPGGSVQTLRDILQRLKARSAERRVGKERRSRWSPDH